MTRSLVVATAVALALAGCSGGDDEESAPAEPLGRPDVVVVAEDVKFVPDAYETAPGRNVVRLDNEGNLPHTLVIEDVDGFKLATGGGEDHTDVLTLQKGEYVLYCDVPGHRGSGMEATLTVG